MQTGSPLRVTLYILEFFPRSSGRPSLLAATTNGPEMKLSLTDQLIVVAYLAAIMGIGLAMKRRAAKGMSSYFLGGRRLPWWALAMSGSSSYFDITGTMWIVSTFIVLGLKGMWVHWLWGFPITARSEEHTSELQSRQY